MKKMELLNFLLKARIEKFKKDNPNFAIVLWGMILYEQGWDKDPPKINTQKYDQDLEP
jgi:hypothetical protein